MATGKRIESDSSVWRITTSNNKQVELANAVRSLRKVIGLMDNNTVDVNFSSLGMSYNDHDNKVIRIDPKFARGAPIEPADFDVLVGLASHEAMHTQAKSHQINHNYGDLKQGNITPDGVAAIGEEVYCDNIARRKFPIAFGYLRKARIAYKGSYDNLDWNNVLTAWSAIAVYGILPPADIPDRTARALRILTKLSLSLGQHDIESFERRRMYSDTSIELVGIQGEIDLERKLSKNRAEIPSDEDWGSLDEVEDPDLGGNTPATEPDSDEGEGASNNEANSGEGDTDPGDGADSEPSEQDDESPDGENDEGEFLPSRPSNISGDFEPAPLDLAASLQMDSGETISAEMAREIQEALDSDMQDVTTELAGLGFKIPKTIDGVIYQRSNGNPEPDFDHSLYNQLVWIKLLLNSAERQTFRGKESGKIDTRNLYRAATDRHPFKRTKKVHRTRNKIVLVLDASGSMSNSSDLLHSRGFSPKTKMNPVYKAAAALHKALPEVVVYSYSSSHDEVRITEHTAKGTFDKIEPEGGTPSGPAILLAAARNKDALIIHFTDGDANMGMMPSEVWPIIEKQFPKVCLVEVKYGAISTRRSKGDIIAKGVTTIHIDNLDDFGAVLREALKPWYQAAL
jgi:hypothetical protein